MILDALPAAHKLGSELLLRGAPLRNRTVDLLLTIHTSPGSLPGKHLPKDSNSVCLAPALASGIAITRPSRRT